MDFGFENLGFLKPERMSRPIVVGFGNRFGKNVRTNNRGPMAGLFDQ